MLAMNATTKLQPGIAGLLFALLLWQGCQGLAFADDEAPNPFYVTANGPMYAKSVPAEHYGTEGKTYVYVADTDTDNFQPEVNTDRLLYTFDWYSPFRLYLGFYGSMIRLGPWPRGSQASEDDLAIALYHEDKLLASYSTLDLAGSPDAVERSVSHYVIIREIRGYRWLPGNKGLFELETTNGELLSFDVATGAMTRTPIPATDSAGNN